MLSKNHRRLRRFCAWLIGIVFILSGTFKLIDPVGTGLKISEYWSLFHMSFMRWSSAPLGHLLPLVEAVLGVMLVTGVWPKVAAIATTALTACFTLLTLVLAIVNPAMDCGCFGDVVHLGNLQTFLKNIVLLALCAVAFIPFRDLDKPKKRKYVTFGICSLASLALLIHCSLFLPLKDFTDYRPGSQLSAARTEGEANIFEASFIYEKDGEERVFTLDQDLPDTTWHFVRTELTGTVDESARLAISDWETGECLDTLAVEGNVLVLSYYRSGKEKARAHEMLAHASSLGYTPLCLSLDREEHEDFCYASDRRNLVGLNRSNGGLTLIQDGIVVKKWSRLNYPSDETLSEISAGEPLETISDVQYRSDMLLEFYLLGLFLILFLV